MANTLYSKLASAQQKVASTDGKLRSLGVNLQYEDRAHQQKMQNRSNNFAALGGLLNAGASLYDMYKDNRKLIDYAEGKGFTTQSNKFTNWFGNPKFMMEGKQYGREHILGLKAYDDYQGEQNLLKAIRGY